MILVLTSPSPIPIFAEAEKSGAIRAETDRKLRVAINGFGRIGRDFLRCWHGRESSSLEVVAINDVNAVENVCYNRRGEVVLNVF